MGVMIVVYMQDEYILGCMYYSKPFTCISSSQEAVKVMVFLLPFRE